VHVFYVRLVLPILDAVLQSSSEIISQHIVFQEVLEQFIIETDHSRTLIMLRAFHGWRCRRNPEDSQNTDADHTPMPYFGFDVLSRTSSISTPVDIVSFFPFHNPARHCIRLTDQSMLYLVLYCTLNTEAWRTQSLPIGDYARITQYIPES